MSTVAILQEFQKDSDKPSERIKRSAAHCLVRKGILEWVVRNVLARRRKVAIFVAVPAKHESPRACEPYEHHIEPKICRINRREMEELERWRGYVDVMQLV